MNDQRDEYLENEYLVLEMCDLTIQNAGKINLAVVKRAREIKHETEERIRLYKLHTGKIKTTPEGVVR